MKGTVISFALAAAASVAAQAPTRFSSKVEAVRVDVLATADGRPLVGLTWRDFELRDNGVLQDVNLAASEQMPVNVTVALDASSSLTPDRLAALRNAGRALITKLRPGDSVALNTFSHLIRVQQPAAADLSQVEQGLTQALEPGQTALIDAVVASITLAEAAPGRPLLMIFSDGLDTASWLNPSEAIGVARRSETVVYAISAIEGPRAAFLRDISAATGGQLLAVRSSGLDAAFTRILEEFRQRYLLSYEPKGVTRGGWHRIEVKVKRRGVTVRARPGYFDR